MPGALSLQSTKQAQGDLNRIARELANLQAQVASSKKAYDLVGFGASATRLLSAQTIKASTDSRGTVLEEMTARFGVQAAALSQVADVARDLAQVIREATSADDGRGIGIQLDVAFGSLLGALNEKWNGQPIFSGDRATDAPVKISSLDELLAAATPADLYNESDRRSVIDTGYGPPVEIAPKASDVSQDLFAVLKHLKQVIDSGAAGQPMLQATHDELLDIAVELDNQASAVNYMEAKNGTLQSRFEVERQRLQARSDLLTKEIGDQADADIAQVSIRLNALLVQYQAAAKTFSDLSSLTILNYLTP